MAVGALWHYERGAYYLSGGSSKFAENLLPVIQSSGGDVLTFAAVEKLLIENNEITGVAMKDGHIIKANTVVSAAGARNTIEKLMPEEVAQRILQRLYKYFPKTAGHVAYYELSTPLTNDYFGCWQKGEIYGLDIGRKCQGSARWLRPKTKVKGLYLSGQDIGGPAVMGATVGGLLAAMEILGFKRFSLIKKIIKS